MDPSWHARIASPDFLSDLGSKPLDDVRDMRSACGQIEAQLSFARRLVQGRLDIVQAERDRRAAGLPASNLAELVAALPEMLSGRVQGSGAAFRSRDIGENDDPVLEAELDSILDGQSLVSLPASTDAHISAVADRLVALERTISDRRRRALEAFDALSAEVIRRFRDGEVSVESVLG
jgi:hypothetical protein